uniref:(California timema) hypothetical protein n=1 Tax=Timema californicum TaxID=61474 RepID=A0A7R9JHP1_TIMCA|nr:unnamed protein product [Timema californicum]
MVTPNWPSLVDMLTIMRTPRTSSTTPCMTRTRGTSRTSGSHVMGT